ncbi:hypothetical protein OJF2_20150 [Aquisphaera giovannonii]|uniref:Uncharacterized protein n=1 Tax=Aquisphaera giovannonii TaxID=406548 RepID=A0A5B9VYU3_9BACT|nr:glycosyltransferase family 2 protein [Aquisphaera giovannonii]QEH33513.1 hypothetical protein OJF2_20150 [Aquisphaera giovannonii]
MDIDLIVLSRDLSPLREDVRAGIAAQRGVTLTVHRCAGTRHPDDPHRRATIARARNEMKRFGSRPLVMFLDDDVVLGPGCVSALAEGLRRRAGFAALAADSAAEMGCELENWDCPSHVGMAAVLFRRRDLAGLTFRWDDERCECRCCCDDLRAAGRGIGYLRGAAAWHRPGPEARHPARPHPDHAAPSAAASSPRGSPGRILAAFDRRDQRRFRKQFMKTLREFRNDEPVWAFAYGLSPLELEQLAAIPNLTVVSIPASGDCPALRRLEDFPRLLAEWPADTPVAYWDAGDVLFQSRLGPLWDLVAAHPDRILVAPEPLSYPENPVIRTWSDYVIDPVAREETFRIMSSQTFLNSGFAAGTARSLMAYCREGVQLLRSPFLWGMDLWADQPALNLYCHAHPESFRIIDRGWNYALAGRPPDQYFVGEDGRGYRTDGGPVHVLHGNSGTLNWLDRTAFGPAARYGPAPPAVSARR